MKIPRNIKIGGFNWEVKQSGEISTESSTFGSTHTQKQKIFIDPTETQQKKEQTFIHEVMHAIWWQVGLNTRYKGEQKHMEEEIVDAMSHGLYQVLKDNNMLR